MSVSSPLVSVVSVARCCCCDTEGPWFSLSNTSTGSANKITDGETTELRSHTEQFLGSNWSLIDPEAGSSPSPPQTNRDTPFDVLWPESTKTKDLQSADLNHEKMSYKHGANEE